MQDQDSSIVEWRSVPNYEGIYEVSNFGDVRRLAGYRCKETRVLSRATDAHGYPVCVLRKDGKSKQFKHHRLVAMAFIPGDWSMDVNHKNSVRDDCRVDNLEWCNQPTNVAHAKAKGHYNKRLTSEERQAARAELLDGASQASLARKYGVTRQAMFHVAHF